jgi:hypothetical protein
MTSVLKITTKRRRKELDTVQEPAAINEVLNEDIEVQEPAAVAITKLTPINKLLELNNDDDLSEGSFHRTLT